ncbi:MAG TPA: arginase family protein [Thermomicrobiales bacterium]|jgi:arginase|nr:arginase family protein [Thermomicrobiales bacterium]
MLRSVHLIGAPSSAGSYAPGQEQAPAALRRAGLSSAMRSRAIDLTDHGDLPGFRWRPDPDRPATANLDVVVRVATGVADLVETARGADAHGTVLVLGGDCTVGVGTVAGLARSGERVGLIYFDGDVDLNVPATGDGPLDWMGVAHLLDLDGAEDALAEIGPRRPLIAPADILFVAPSNISAPEQAAVDRLGLAVIPLGDVVAEADAVIDRMVAWAAGFDRIAVHLDVDVLQYTDFPVAEGTYRRPGLDADGLARLLTAACALPAFRALTVTEVNPDHWPDEATGERFVALLADAFSGRGVAERLGAPPRARPS